MLNLTVAGVLERSGAFQPDESGEASVFESSPDDRSRNTTHRRRKRGEIHRRPGLDHIAVANLCLDARVRACYLFVVSFVHPFRGLLALPSFSRHLASRHLTPCSFFPKFDPILLSSFSSRARLSQVEQLLDLIRRIIPGNDEEEEAEEGDPETPAEDTAANNS